MEVIERPGGIGHAVPMTIGQIAATAAVIACCHSNSQQRMEGFMLPAGVNLSRHPAMLRRMLESEAFSKADF